MSNHIAILPGASSPNKESQKPFFNLIETEAKNRGWEAKVYTYEGNGHAPNFGDGLDIVKNSGSVKDTLTEYPDGSVLFCRCYGCFVGAYLHTFHPDEMKRFRKVIFWAPSPYWMSWKTVFVDNNGIEAYNKIAGPKGCQISAKYLTNMLPMECYITKLPKKNYVFAGGDTDPLCTVEDITYLSDVFKRSNEFLPTVNIVHGAKHVITHDDHSDIKKAYLDIIFCD